jgi:hypothetical protein
MSTPAASLSGLGLWTLAQQQQHWQQLNNMLWLLLLLLLLLGGVQSLSLLLEIGR